MPDEVKAGEGDLESSHRHRCAPGVQFPPTHPHHQHHQQHHHYEYHSIIKHYHDICRCHHHLRHVLVFIDVKWGSCPQVHFPPTWPTACNLCGQVLEGVWRGTLRISYAWEWWYCGGFWCFLGMENKGKKEQIQEEEARTKQSVRCLHSTMVLLSNK